MSTLSHPKKAPPKEFGQIIAAFEDKTVLEFTKKELEDCLLILGKCRILSEENRARASEMGDTLRLLLAARQSQEMHSQSLIVARVALYISLIALFLAAGQFLLSIPAVSRAFE
ncbi:MAG: hypothetical protein H3C27_11205 [Opitutaceae bacterium]|nr:hypothetical protein [Opitutaceae bacterium]